MKRSRYRSKYDIMAEIMQNCLLPRGKTNIMYEGNLSFAQANSYLSLLTSLGLLSKENGKYETTDKGHQFISAYNHLGKIIGIPTHKLLQSDSKVAYVVVRRAVAKIQRL